MVPKSYRFGLLLLTLLIILIIAVVIAPFLLMTPSGGLLTVFSQGAIRLCSAAFLLCCGALSALADGGAHGRSSSSQSNEQHEFSKFCTQPYNIGRLPGHAEDE
jgi:hypothetical protein